MTRIHMMRVEYESVSGRIAERNERRLNVQGNEPNGTELDDCERDEHQARVED